MKKIFVIIIAAVIGYATMDASQLTPAQSKAKKEIFNALKKYVTNITDDGEESLSFKYDGATFQASVHTLNPQTLYLTLFARFSLPEEYNSEISNIAAFNAASGKPVCSFSSNGALAFSCEMYAKEAKPFISVLPEMLAALSSSEEKFLDEYEKAEKEYTPSYQVAGISALDINSNEYIYPKTAGTQTDETKLYLAKVTLDPNYTILDMVSYNGGQIMNCTMNRNAYIMANGRKFNLIKADGITYSSTYTDYPNWQSGREVSLAFRLYFPPLPKGTITFDFIESPTNGWQLKGVELKHGNTYAINGERIKQLTINGIASQLRYRMVRQ